MDVLRVLILADDPLARAGLVSLLEGRPGLDVAGQGPASGAPQEASDAGGAHVLIWDAGVRPDDSYESLHGCVALGLPVVALIPDATSAAAVLEVGARGVLFRDADGGALAAALAAVRAGVAVLDPDVASHLAHQRGRPLEAAVEDLTPRELQVLQLLAEGLHNKAIARRLGVSEHTAKFHVNAVLGKLDAHSRTEAVTRAARHGLIVL